MSTLSPTRLLQSKLCDFISKNQPSDLEIKNHFGIHWKLVKLH